MPEQLDCETASAAELAGAVVDYITEYGWTKRTLGVWNGPVCLVGAISAVCTGDPGNGYALLGGYGQQDGKAPASVVALGRALEAEDTFPSTGVVYHLQPRVDDTVVTAFNDRAHSVEEALLPFKKIAGRI